jgi:hypothetical protein
MVEMQYGKDFYFSRKGEEQYITPGWKFVCSFGTLVTDYAVEICNAQMIK